MTKTIKYRKKIKVIKTSLGDLKVGGGEFEIVQATEYSITLRGVSLYFDLLSEVTISLEEFERDYEKIS